MQLYDEQFCSHRVYSEITLMSRSSVYYMVFTGYSSILVTKVEFQFLEV